MPETEALVSMFNVLDFVVVGGILVTTYYFLYRKKTEPPIKKITANPSSEVRNQSFIERMKSGGRSVVIFYGSQTGTAEEFAARLAQESKRFALKGLVADPEDCEMEELTRMGEIENSLAVFMLATYGEGDATDNCVEFHDWLQETDVSLKGLRYAIFGLGNKTYEHYNKIGKYADQRLEQLGAERVVELGLGDDDANIEEDFVNWKENFWPTVCEFFGVYELAEDVSSRQYSLSVHENVLPGQLFSGEPAKLGSYRNQKPPHDPKNPFLSRMLLKRELHKSGQRSCMHVELDLTSSRLRYQAGDHVGVLPYNEEGLVLWVAERLGGLDLDTQFTLTNTDEEANKRHPFPCPTTYRTALTHYVDLTSCPRTNVLKELAECATVEGEKDFLLSMTRATKEAKELYSDWIIAKHRTTLHVLQDLPSIHPSIDLLLELLPRLQSRYYSISSSSRADPNRLSITAVLIDYTTPTQRHMTGVATGNMAVIDPSNEDNDDESSSTRLPIFIRKSQFRLPARSTTPIIMVGPGTGIAPFMAFLQERRTLQDDGKILGPAYLYFGCRRKAEDFIYEEQLKQYLESNVLTKLYVAFSREQPHKVYVQHLMRQNGQEVWEALAQKCHVYVCGDARNMAQDVDKELHCIAREHGNLNSTSCDDFFKKLRASSRYSCDVWS